MIKKENSNHAPEVSSDGKNSKTPEAVENSSAQEVDSGKFTKEQLIEIAREKENLARTYYDQLIRLKAEFENYRKRVEREKETHRSWAKEEILIKQISLLDVMEQALVAARNTEDISAVVKGLEMIVKEFERMLADEGVSIVGTDGIFDTSRHEVVETIEDKNSPDGTVKEVLSKGYAINGRLIRPAKVKIVKNPPPEEENVADKSNDNLEK